ncbi:MAG: histidine kinase [Lacrimispora sp.]|uniref:sensor histidine kinase n=1 Tax=Lacrimispora sp. TaxID=2719234 RepID=UPI0039E48DDA
MLKRLLIIITVTIAGVLVLLLSILWDKAHAPEAGLTAKQGRIDASAWDIEHEPVIRLDGEWEFYWNKLLTPEDFQSENAEQPSAYMQVPSLWSKSASQGTTFPVFGCATYRLVMENVPSQRSLALKKVNARFSSRVYVNGKQILIDGIPALQEEDYRSGNTPKLAFFESDSGRIEIIIQVANYEYLNSGIPSSPELGREDIMLRQHQRQNLTVLLIFAALCTIVLLYMTFFIITWDGALKNPVLPLFSLFCLLLAWGNGMSDQRSLLLLLPEVPFTFAFKLKDFCLSADFIVMIWIFRKFRSSLLSQRFARLVSLVYISYLMMILVLPLHVYYKIHVYVMAFNTVILLVLLVRAVHLYVRNAEGFLLFVALLSVNLYSADTILFSLGIKIRSGFMQVFILIFTAVMIAYLSMEYRNTVERLRHSMKQAQDAEIAFLRAQIKPHFLYNSLSVIAVQTTQEPQKAKSLLYDLTDYLRGSFHFEAHDGMIPLSGEMNTVKAYLSIEKARFGDLLEVEYYIEEGLDTMVPLLSIQPIVENAVRHGIFKRAEGGRLKVQIFRESDFVVIRVEDNGVGIPKELLEGIRRGDSPAAGVGLKNIRSRLERYKGSRLKIESTEGVGTVVTLEIPYREVLHEDNFSG